MRRNDEARAIGVMERVGVDESLIGDIVEQHRAGRSGLWLWRQTGIAVAARVASIVYGDLTVVGVAAVVVAVALALPYVWMHVLWHYAVMLDVAWYPSSINWLARSSPDALWRVVVFLHPWAWTYIAGWCAMLGVIALSLVRLWPNHVNLILAVFVLSNISQSLPPLVRSVLDWSHEATNPAWISNLVCHTFLVFIAIPLSIRVGGRIGDRAKSHSCASTN